MKLLSLIILAVFSLAYKSNAVHSYSEQSFNHPQPQLNTFADPAFLQQNALKDHKGGIIKRVVLKMAHKSILRKITKGKLYAVADQSRPAESANPNKRGLVSIIFAGVGLLFLFIPSGLAGIGGLFAIAGFILGIIGLRKDEDITMALVGTIVGALVLALYAVVIYT